MSGNDKHYWFKKKHRGIGLGRPVVKQGWMVYIAYIVLVLVPLFVLIMLHEFPDGQYTWVALANQGVWTVLLIIIARVKTQYPPKPEVTDEEEEYWFPKTDSPHGIGYAFPDTWQGMLVLVVFWVGLAMPVLFKPLLGSGFMYVFIPNALIWAIFLISMLVKHGEK